MIIDDDNDDYNNGNYNDYHEIGLRLLTMLSPVCSWICLTVKLISLLNIKRIPIWKVDA